MTYDKWDTKDTLCDDRDKTSKKMLKTLGMIVKDVYMVRSTHFHKYKQLKPPKKNYIHCVTRNIDNILLILQKGQNT